MRFVEAVAPSVINEELCRTCIELLQPKNAIQASMQAEDIQRDIDAKKSAMPFGRVECLAFSFQSAGPPRRLGGMERC